MPKAKEKSERTRVGDQGDDPGAINVLHASTSAANPAVITLDEASETSSQGHEDFFEKDVRAFLRRTRDTVTQHKVKFEAAEKTAAAEMARLADRRERLERDQETRERVLQHAIASLPTAGAQATATVLQKKEDLRERLRVIRKRRMLSEEAIQKEVEATEENLYKSRKEYGDALTDYEREKDIVERRAAAARTDLNSDYYRSMEFLERAEKSPPGEGATPMELENYEEDMRQLRLLRNIRASHEKYQAYIRNCNGSNGASGLPATTSKRKKISGPKPTDPPSKRTRVTKGSYVVAPREDAIDVAAAKIALFIREWLELDGPEAGDDETEVAAGETGEVNSDDVTFVHERQLEGTLKPDVLKTPGWSAPPLRAHFGDSAPSPELLFDALQKVIQQQEVSLRVAHLHSLALSRVVMAVADLKATVLSDVRREEEAAAVLRKANQAVMLANDPDIKQLPFRNSLALNDFFRNSDRVKKLSQYLLTYVPFVDKVFAANVADAMFHPALQERVYWVGTSRAKPR